MNIRTIVVAIAATILAGTVQAQDAQQKLIDEAFAKIDVDNNGVITKEEFATFMKGYLADQEAAFEKSFAELDTNKDGFIDKTEAQANSGIMAYFDQIDANHDGKISKAELHDAMQAAQEAGMSGK